MLYEGARVMVVSDQRVPRGSLILWKKQRMVWCGKLGSPIEDVDADSVQLNPFDLERMLKLLRE